MKNRYPIYIPSYQRWQDERRLTTNFFEEKGISYNIIVEPEEEEKYRSAIDTSIGTVLVLPHRFKKEYHTYIDSDAPLGSGPARNFGMHHAEENGYSWYWVVDDNIRYFTRRHKNNHVPVNDATPFGIIEDFVEQYENIAMAGMQYQMFQMKRRKSPPLTLNTRIYSNNLINIDLGYEWQGRYNEDTDLSLRMLKDGYATVLFNSFLANKQATQKTQGGNTDTVYADKSDYDESGTYEKSKALKRQHPIVTSVTKKFGRWHHDVDYSPFKGNKLERKNEPPEPRDYNLKLKDKQ